MICIIPARGGSKGCPGKTTRLINGMPLIVWTIGQAIDSGCFESIYVSSEDKVIGGHALCCDVEWIERPKEFAEDWSTTEEVLVHAVNHLGHDGDVCLLQCTSPLRKKDDISKSVELYKNAACETLISVTKDSNICMWNETEPVTFTSRAGRQYKTPWYIENGSIYITSAKNILDGGWRLNKKPVKFYEMEDWQRFEIDTPMDFSLVEWVMREKRLC